MGGTQPRDTLAWKLRGALDWYTWLTLWSWGRGGGARKKRVQPILHGKGGAGGGSTLKAQGTGFAHSFTSGEGQRVVYGKNEKRV